MVKDEKVSASPSYQDQPGQSQAPDVAETVGKLLELVPTIPKNGQQRLSMVDLLQHVIDYIWDLQAVLSSPAAGVGPNEILLMAKRNEDEWEKL